MTAVQHTLRGTIRGLMGSLEINGVPLQRWETASQRNHGFSSDVDLWVRPGDNLIRTTLSPAGTVRPWFNLEFNEWTKSQVRRTEIANERMEIVDGWPTVTNQETVRLDHAPPTRMWSDAEPLVAEESTRVEALLFVEQLMRTLREGSVDEILEARRYLDRDFGASKGYSAERLEKARRQAATYWRDRKAFTLQPLDLRRVRISLVGDNRLLWVRSGSGGKPIVYHEGKGVLAGSQTMYLAKIYGSWTWVR